MGVFFRNVVVTRAKYATISRRRRGLPYVDDQLRYLQDPGWLNTHVAESDGRLLRGS